MSKPSFSDEAIARAAREAFEVETRRCAEVARLCWECGLPERSLEMIDSRQTAEEVAELLRRAAIGAKWDKTIGQLDAAQLGEL